MTGSSHNISVS